MRIKGSIPKNQFPGLLKRLYNNLPPENLVSGFHACGIVPLNRQEVLKKLPEVNRDPGRANISSALNNSVMELLKKHCGVEEEPKQKQKKRGHKITPGKAIVSLDTPTCSTSSANDSQKTASLTVSFSLIQDEEWICASCEKAWEENGDDKWIVCDACDKQFHLQCSGIVYRTQQYYSLDIESMNFLCADCK